MEAICSSETSVATQQTTRRHIPEDDTIHNHRCGNLKSCKLEHDLHTAVRGAAMGNTQRNEIKKNTSDIIIIKGRVP
jgi:hypothetical protein